MIYFYCYLIGVGAALIGSAAISSLNAELRKDALSTAGACCGISLFWPIALFLFIPFLIIRSKDSQK